MLVSGGGGSGLPPYKVARTTVFRPKPNRKVSRGGGGGGGGGYSPPAVTSSGHYSSGGGAPSSPPSYSQGPVHGVGHQGPSAAERAAARRERIQARREKRQAARKEYRSKKRDYRSFIPNDETYQGQVSSLQKQLEQFILSNKDQRGDVRQDFRLSRERMGKERTNALDQMEEDFAARGMLNSSEYLDSIGKYNEDYQTKMGDLQRDKNRNIEDLLESLGMYRSSNRESRQNARAEAVRRRAAEFGGWNPSKKPKFMR